MTDGDRPRDLYDVAQQVTDEVMGPGTWQDPRKLFAVVRPCPECRAPVAARPDEAIRGCGDHS